MNVKDVSWEGFPSRWSAKQERNFAISAGMLRKVIVNNQYIATGFHKMLRDTRGGVRCGINKAWRIISFSHNDDGIIHRALFLQSCHDLGNGRCTQANSTIDAHYILVALVKDGVDRNGSLPRLAVSEYQLALTASHGNERIDDF